MAQSRAADEYAETCLKLRPMLNALGAGSQVTAPGCSRQLESDNQSAMQGEDA